jgi:transcriptional regulator with XRE-family HTH domain
MAGKRPDIEQQLRQAIEESPLSQYELAKVSGVNKGILSRFVRGERTITLSTAARLAEALDLDLRPARQARKSR